MSTVTGAPEASDAMSAVRTASPPMTPTLKGPALIARSSFHVGRDSAALKLVGQGVELGATGHLPGQFLDGDVFLLRLPQAPTPFEDQEAVTDRIGVVRVVCDEDDAQPAVPRLRDVAQHDPGLFYAQRRGRLVQDQHPLSLI